MGAFDAPVDPAPWVAGLGAIGTALWGVVAVRRRLVMAQQLATFEARCWAIVLSRLMPPPFQMPGIKRFSLALKGSF